MRALAQHPDLLQTRLRDAEASRPGPAHPRGKVVPTFHLQAQADCIYLAMSRNSRWLSREPSTRPSAVPRP